MALIEMCTPPSSSMGPNLLPCLNQQLSAAYLYERVDGLP